MIQKEVSLSQEGKSDREILYPPTYLYFAVSYYQIYASWAKETENLKGSR